MSKPEAWLGAATTSLRQSPLRTLLSTLGVVIGVAALVAILTLSRGLERFTREQVGGTTDIQVVVVEPRVFEYVDGLTVQRESVLRFTRDDVEAVRDRLGDVGEATLLMRAAARVGLPGDSARHAAMLLATLPDAHRLTSDSVIDGRFLAASDVEGDERVTVLSDSLAAKIGVTAAGGEVRVDSLDHRVVGIVTATGDDRAPARLYVPLSDAAAARLDVSGRQPAALVARSHRFEETERMQATLEAWLEERSGDPSAYEIGSYRERAQQAATAFMVFRLVMGSIAGISLLVGGIGIMNILLASVSERTREIGVRRAIGARSRDILLQFLSESVVISAVGSVLGVALGLGGAYALSAIVRVMSKAPIHAGFAWSSVVTAAGAAIVIGLVFGTYPARRAARLSPIEAIRHE